MLSSKDYAKLSKASQLLYVAHLRTYWIEFEKKYPTTQFPRQSVRPSLWLNTAWAQDGRQCIIGGVVLNAVMSGNRPLCPTRTRRCEGEEDGFQCGPLYANACIPRQDISDLSERCLAKSLAKPLTRAEYDVAKKDIEAAYNRLCGETAAPNTLDGCNVLTKTFEQAPEAAGLVGLLETALPQPASAVVTAVAAGVGEAYRQTIGSTTTTLRRSEEGMVEGEPVRISGAPAVVPTSDTSCSPGKYDDGRPRDFPMFSLTAANRCHFVRNGRYLDEYTGAACGPGWQGPGNKMFVTEIRTENQILNGEQINFFRGIIREVTEVQTAQGLIYRMKMLRPNTQVGGGPLHYANVDVQFRGGKYYLIVPGKPAQEVQIFNENRTSEVSQSRDIHGTQDALDRTTAGLINLAMNCSIYNNLAQAGALPPVSPRGTIRRSVPGVN